MHGLCKWNIYGIYLGGFKTLHWILYWLGLKNTSDNAKPYADTWTQPCWGGSRPRDSVKFVFLTQASSLYHTSVWDFTAAAWCKVAQVSSASWFQSSTSLLRPPEKEFHSKKCAILGAELHRPQSRWTAASPQTREWEEWLAPFQKLTVAASPDLHSAPITFKQELRDLAAKGTRCDPTSRSLIAVRWRQRLQRGEESACCPKVTHTHNKIKV